MLTVADMGGGGGVKMAKKVLTYFMDGPYTKVCTLQWAIFLTFEDSRVAHKIPVGG